MRSSATGVTRPHEPDHWLRQTCFRSAPRGALPSSTPARDRWVPAQHTTDSWPSRPRATTWPTSGAWRTSRRLQSERRGGEPNAPPSWFGWTVVDATELARLQRRSASLTGDVLWRRGQAAATVLKRSPTLRIISRRLSQRNCSRTRADDSYDRRQPFESANVHVRSHLLGLIQDVPAKRTQLSSSEPSGQPGASDREPRESGGQPGPCRPAGPSIQYRGARI